MAQTPAPSPATLPPEDGLAHWRSHLAHQARTALAPDLGELVRRQAQSYGDQALLCLFEDQQTLSYRQLDERSDALAAALAAAGLQAGDRLAVMLGNCVAYHVTWVALAKLGAIIVPVNPSYTPRELRHVLGDAQAAGWVYHPEAADTVASVVPDMPLLRSALLISTGTQLEGDSAWHRLLRSGLGKTLIAASPLTLNTVLNLQYTSGTTGFPKGCILTHGYWLNLAHCAMSLHTQRHSRFFTAQPFFYMDPFWQLLQTLCSGGTLYAAKKLSASKFLGWLAEHRIEWAQVPELALKSMDGVAPADLVLRQAFTFGWSALGRQSFVERYGVVANESFGMTEIGLGLAMPVPWPTTDRATSVGVPALRRDARLMVDQDGQLREAAPGETGELWLRGEHMFKGYWNNPQANQAVWQGDWFRTGDAFVRDELGFYKIVGRFKDMIRRSSENIAAREVEAVVRMLPQVLDCAAVGVPDATRGEEVKVWVQLQEGLTPEALSPPALLAHCQANLAPFKVPRYVAYADSFPRTSSNKIAKHLLPATGASGCFDRLKPLIPPKAASA